MNQMGPYKNLLHEDGQFRLYGTNDRSESFLSHSCAGPRTNNTWYVTGRHGCSVCGEIPSDEIVGLYVLHNWDRIQKRRPATDG